MVLNAWRDCYQYATVSLFPTAAHHQRNPKGLIQFILPLEGIITTKGESMKNFPEYFKTTAEYTNTVDPIKDFPDFQRVPAENRFILIKEYEHFLKDESSRLGRKFRKTQALNEFCKEKKISPATFYEYLRSYGRHGISGLLTAYGNRKGKGQYGKSIMPIIWEVIEPGKGYMHSYKKLASTCMRKGVNSPSYNTFLRLCNAKGLSDSLRRPKPIRIKLTATRKNDPKKKPVKRKVKKRKVTLRKVLMIDKDDPLACLHKLSEIIEAAPSISPEIKEPALRFFDHALEITAPDVSKYKPLTLEKPLSENESLTLEHYKSSVHKNHRDRATAILMADQHYTMLDILMAIGRPAKTVYGWFRRFKKERLNFIETEIDSSKYNKEARERKNRIIKILHSSPADFNINRTSWKLGDIARVYEDEYGKKLSTSSIARSIKNTSYSWRRAKRVLTSPDPDYRVKVMKVLNTLRTLGSNDTFFFIDEGGPYAVKKYGGKSLTIRGTIKTYPQFQKPKGRVTFIAALDALKNQVLLFFSKTKDTNAVVCLIKILYYRYHGYSNLCLTWDCASWHRSKGIQRCVQDLNAKNNGPKIKIVPLPKQSQFLNVIESVFSGMKKAVIHNSDYKSEYEMKMAILRHFQERNEYFKVNPKRAGNKIWDKEYYDLEKIDSGLFRRM